MGERLLPEDSYWGNADGINGVIPDTSRSDQQRGHWFMDRKGRRRTGLFRCGAPGWIRGR